MIKTNKTMAVKTYNILVEKVSRAMVTIEVETDDPLEWMQDVENTDSFQSACDNAKFYLEETNIRSIMDADTGEYLYKD